MRPYCSGSSPALSSPRYLSSSKQRQHCLWVGSAAVGVQSTLSATAANRGLPRPWAPQKHGLRAHRPPASPY